MGLPLCVIGGGLIGLRHAAVAVASADVTLTAVAEPDPARRATLAAMGYPVCADADDAPAATRAAIVATPTPDHADTATRALERGWAVLVEKPVTATLAEGTALCARAEALGLPLLTGHHRRCHHFVTEALARLPDLGRLVGIQGLWALRKHDEYFRPDWRRARGSGPILTNLSHEIDLLRLFAGEIASVTAQTSDAARALPIEDTAALTLRFARGALGTFLISDAGLSPWSFESASAENPHIAATGQDPLRLIGTAASMSFPSLALWSGAADWRSAPTRRAGPTLPKLDPIAEQLRRFARVADGGADPLLATGRDGLATLAATLAVLEAAESGRATVPAPVPSPRKETAS